LFVSNNAPTIANLSGDSVTFVAGGSPVRLDAETNAAITDPDPFGFEVIRVGTGFSGGPLFIVEVPDGSGRMYVVEKNGTIRILNPDTGVIAATAFLSVAGEVSTSGEQGLLGFALSPNFATSGIFYIYMTNTNGDNEVRRYTTVPGSLDQADSGSADRILLLPHPGAANHNAGWIAFGPDNLLYIPTGDGAVGSNAQSLNSLLGKILRIDPGSDAFPADPDRDYAIPSGNPYAGATPGLDEIWATGLRNPFRASFDPLNGNLWIGDVGQNAIEEIDLAPAGQAGLNFGWDVREGTQQHTGPNSLAFTPPVTEYGHGTGPFQGSSVTGGLVYRGPIAGLDGQYVFGDFFDELWSAPVGSLVQDSTRPSSGFTLRNTAFTPNAGTIDQITSFATDQAGNLYITDLGGEVFRVRVSAAPNFAGGSLSVEIGAGEGPAEDRLGFATGAVTLSNGTNFDSQVRVGGVLVGTIAPNGTGVNGEPLIVLFSSGANQARITTLVQAVTYSNVAADPTPGNRSITIRLNDGAGTSGGGNDTAIVTTSVNVSTEAGVILTGTPGEDQLTGGTGDDTISGLAGNDTLTGLAGNDFIDGGAGADAMAGGLGNDTYVVDDGADAVNEASAQGNDTIYAAVSYTLGEGSHAETLSAITWAATDPLNLIGNSFNNTVYGNAGVNLLNGGGGTDLMIGFGGDDTYVIDHAGDLIIDNAGQGNDAVYAAVSFTLNEGAHVETVSAISWAATDPLNLTGNSLTNSVYGNAGTNILNGGGGTDFMIGFGGNDTYIVDHAGDLIIETAGQGSDIAYAAVSFMLNEGAHVEILSAIAWVATDPLNLTGNSLANTVYGNAGANLLNGGGGADTLVGFGGNDTYVVDNAGDLIDEASGAGSDTVYAAVSFALNDGAHVETVSAISWAATDALDISGNNLANTVYGNAGANTLNGGGGADTLIGFGGADTYAFTTALAGGNVGTIQGFISADDTIALDDAVFAGLAPGALAASAFRTGSAAQDSDDRIIYDPATGNLLFDADGNGTGAAVLFATLQSAPVIAASDFVVI
jgi:Ca2+-binding RTX toxin-like protein/glucose/arabinose dehydrogenase